jgi:uncharacterized membrane protein YphA (DoxX/SURF4 family)
MIPTMDTAAPSTTPQHSAWPWWTRVAFRLSFLFWAIFCLESGGINVLFGIIPPAALWLDKIVSWPSEHLAAWLGVHLFHLSQDVVYPHPTGSGDTAAAYLAALTAILIAVLGTILWSAIAEPRRKRLEYQTLYAWLRLAMRFVLAATLLSYGFSKVFDLQFPPPQSYRLEETYGNSSPMGLLWTFMGASVPYTIFSGFAEVIPGVLLLFRRTTTAGALLSSAVMLNVVMLNLCYDVPVKLYSTELLLMSLFLLLPDVAPLWRLLILRRDALLTGVWVRRSERKPLRIAAHCLQALVIAYLLYSNVKSGYTQHNQALANKTPKADSLRGAWTVDSSTGWPAEQKWKNVNFAAVPNQNKDYVAANEANGKLDYYFFVPTGAAHDMHFLGVQGSQLHWEQDGAEYVNLKGTWAGKPATMRLHPQPQAPLLSRGFHWVQEEPYYR